MTAIMSQQTMEEKLVSSVIQFIEKNINNTAYSVDNLSVDVGVSRSQLYRKLQLIIGQTPHEFIRVIKLKRSAQLVKESQYNICEIADMVGFNTIKYFNKYFKAEFGVTPTQYRMYNVNNNKHDNKMIQ